MSRRWYVTMEFQFAIDVPEGMDRSTVEEKLLNELDVHAPYGTALELYNRDQADVTHLEPSDA